MPTAYVILPSGEVTVKAIKGLNSYQAIVGGPIEYVPFPTVLQDEATKKVARVQVSCYVNEEGKIHNLPINRKATELVATVLFPDDFISGPMILTGIDTETGEDVDCPIGIKEILQ